MGLTRHERNVPGGGSEFLPALQLDVEPVERWTGTALPKSPAVFAHGYQALARKIANQVSSASGWYPDDGAGTLAAQANSGQAAVTLAAAVLQSQHASLSPIGMLLACRYATGPNRWEIARVTAWTSGTQTVTVHTNLTNTWPSGAKYHLLFDVQLAEYLHILSEFSANNTAAVLEPYFFDWMTDVDLSTSRDPIRTPDLDVGLVNTAVQGATGEVQETSYYYGKIRSRSVRGFMGCKVRLKSVANGSVSLWLARS